MAGAAVIAADAAGAGNEASPESMSVEAPRLGGGSRPRSSRFIPRGPHNAGRRASSHELEKRPSRSEIEKKLDRSSSVRRRLGGRSERPRRRRGRRLVRAGKIRISQA